MSDLPPLTDFCDEMLRLGAVIEVTSEQLPSCGHPVQGGFRLSSNADGTEFMLTYTERGQADVVASASDADTMMERVFVEVSSARAVHIYSQNQPPLTDDLLEAIRSERPEAARQRALRLHSAVSAIQEDLLGRLNAAWRDRQAARNAEEAMRIEDFFD